MGTAYQNLKIHEAANRSFVLSPFHTDSDASSDATIALTQNLEPYKFQYFVHTCAFRMQCEQSIEIHKVILRQCDCRIALCETVLSL